MSDKNPDQLETPQQIPLPLNELTDEESADIFFSFDITALAFLWEHEAVGISNLSLTRIHKKEEQGDLQGIFGILLQFFREIFSNPTTYGYIILAALLVMLATNIGDIQHKIQETMTQMLAPELDAPKPPPPAPKALQAKPKPPKEEAPKPKEPLKLEKPKPIKKAIPPQEPPKVKQRRLDPPEAPKLDSLQKKKLMREEQTPLTKIQTNKRNELANKEMNKLETSTARRSDDAPMTNLGTVQRRAVDSEAASGFKVQARSDSDGPGDLPASFATTTPKRGISDEIPTTSSLSTLGTKPRIARPEDEEIVEAAALTINVAQREAEDEINLDDIIPLLEKSGPADFILEEKFQGRLQKMDNIGPLAHLNANCYGIPDKKVIRYRNYIFRCSKNQIMEAWKQINN
ncbi:MAG: hypothetical protein KKE17_15495 [Proteobacteria bacterium]|nr:hypothetical protein [Pseudomonadota bacterium]MBU1711402.1 hypothetical protein [Pseudomonadota bacterium]